ncbi:MAG: glycosyltransferase, partial [Rikenellaceae bacterium]|nr:glycosyltransferase [Rikenellaceae bacterium]
MLISFVLPVYNVEKYLARCLDSVLAQDLAPDEFEVVVVDDSSTDGSRAVAERYAAADPRIRLLVLSPNGGVAAARNMALDHARGKYVWPVDPDDFLFPGVAGQMVRTMERQQLDMLALLCRTVDEQGGQIEWKYSPKLEIRDRSVLTGQ